MQFLHICCRAQIVHYKMLIFYESLQPRLLNPFRTSQRHSVVLAVHPVSVKNLL